MKFIYALSTFVAFILIPPDVPGASIADAIAGGKLHLSLRYRYEHVNDDRMSGAGMALRNADASTLRTFLGYETGVFHDFSATIDLENVSRWELTILTTAPTARPDTPRS